MSSSFEPTFAYFLSHIATEEERNRDEHGQEEAYYNYLTWKKNFSATIFDLEEGYYSPSGEIPHIEQEEEDQ